MTDRSALGRRDFLCLAGAGAGTFALALPATAQTPRDDMLIVNALGAFNDPNLPPSFGASTRILEPRVLADAKASGMNAVNVTIGYVAGPMEPFEHSVREIGVWDSRLRNHSVDLLKVLTAADIPRARAEGKIGVIYGFQNGAMMGEDASRADIFADLGVRVIQLTYNGPNQLGHGAMAPQNRGLTPLGREVIDALNRNRVMVDLSHSGERTCLEAARHSSQPVSINHTGCRALVDLPRNKTDEELRLVAGRGGFVGIYFMPFLSPYSVATPQDVVAHIAHAVNICGEDHVGIGTDGGTTAVDDLAAYRARVALQIERRRAAGISADGESPGALPFVEGLTGPDQFRQLVRLLEARGTSSGQIEKIMGLNFLRYAREVWGN